MIISVWRCLGSLLMRVSYANIWGISAWIIRWLSVPINRWTGCSLRLLTVIYDLKRRISSQNSESFKETIWSGVDNCRDWRIRPTHFLNLPKWKLLWVRSILNRCSIPISPYLFVRQFQIIQRSCTSRFNYAQFKSPQKISKWIRRN